MKFIILSFLILSSCGDGRLFDIRGQKGTDGSQGSAGATGNTGATGPQGAIGPQGQAGTPAAATTFVKLCPQTPSYPNVFVEYAICLQGKLYGVYSANGGFLTELPPGRYSSNAIGSACNLTVTSNCGIIN